MFAAVVGPAWSRIENHPVDWGLNTYHVNRGPKESHRYHGRDKFRIKLSMATGPSGMPAAVRVEPMAGRRLASASGPRGNRSPVRHALKETYGGPRNVFERDTSRCCLETREYARGRRVESGWWGPASGERALGRPVSEIKVKSPCQRLPLHRPSCSTPSPRQRNRKFPKARHPARVYHARVPLPRSYNVSHHLAILAQSVFVYCAAAWHIVSHHFRGSLFYLLSI
jgi:hypothetical protein